jgi:hypothetical protein
MICLNKAAGRMPMRAARAARVAAFLTGAALASTVWAHKAHQHGLARLDIAVEGRQVLLQLDSPQDNLLGHERAPRSEAEKREAEAAVATLRAGDKLFAFDPAAACVQEKVELDSVPLKLGAGAQSKAAAGHADLGALWSFSCKASPAWVDVGLLDAFKRMARVEVQVAAKGQAKTTLRRPARRVVLGPG